MSYDLLSKINTNNGVLGYSYLTNENEITVDGTTYQIINGFDFHNVSQAVQDAAKFKGMFELGDDIPNITISTSVGLNEEYDEAKRVFYSQHSDYVGNNEQTNSVDIPKYINGWQYVSGNSMVDLPSQLDSTLAEEFTDGNLDVYAVWNDGIKAIRVIVFPKASYNFTPSCNVSIASTNSYTQGNFPLTRNYSKVLHQKNSLNDDIRWCLFEGEVGTNTGANSDGNGCPVLVGGNLIPCYYCVKTGDSITITISGLDAYYTDSLHTPHIIQDGFKPFASLGNPSYVSVAHLSAYFPDTGYTQYTTSLNGTYTITVNNVSTDMTFFIPVVPNTFSITARCSDATTLVASVLGMVNIESANYANGFSAYQIQANCINGETITVSAQPNQGYLFTHWEDGNGNTLSTLGQSFNLSIDTTVNGKTYVACFEQAALGSCIFTYHKSENSRQV